MNKNFVIFKNPHLRYRIEEFGGVVKLKMKTLIINRRQYQFINKIKKVLIYDDLNTSDKQIADGLMKNDILIKVDLDRAKELGFKGE